MAKTRDKKIKGVLLAGGLGTRLHPLTRITNKHLLPVFNKPMIMYPIDTLKRSGIRDILIVCGREHAGHFMNFLGSGKEYGLSFSYAIQDTNNGGIADALRYAEHHADNSNIAVILGDNIFERDFRSEVKLFSGGAQVFFKEVENNNRFGVPVFSKTGKKILRIEEKPKKPLSAYAQTGFYLYDKTVFSKIEKLKPSARGELEITDVNNFYIKAQKMSFGFIQGLWSDAGTFGSLLKVANEVAKWEQ